MLRLDILGQVPGDPRGSHGSDKAKRGGGDNEAKVVGAGPVGMAGGGVLHPPPMPYLDRLFPWRACLEKT